MLADPHATPELWGAVILELYPDEKLLWAGKPTPIRVLIRQINPENVLSVAIAALILGIYGFGCLMFGLSSIPIGGLQIPTLSLLLIPIVALLIYESYGYWRAKQIVYAVSDRRVLIIRYTIDGKVVLAYNLIPFIERRVHANGKGDLIFATETYSPLLYTNYSSTRNYFFRIRKVGFWGIDNALAVERLIVNTFHPKNTDA